MKSRLTAIDAGRGLAMIFVFLSHFSWTVGHSFPDISRIMANVGAIGSPTFMLISGSMLGYLYATKGERFSGTRRMLVNRSVFLLTVGHLLIIGSFIDLPSGNISAGFTRTYITDAIAACIIAGSFLISHVSGWQRILIAVTLYVASWMVTAFFEPSAFLPIFFADILVGPKPANLVPVLQNSFPLIPWFSFYILSTVLGEWLALPVVKNNSALASKRLFLLGISMVIVAISLKAVFWLVRPALPNMTDVWWSVYAFSSPFTKRPPGLVYLLTFGGIGMLMLSALFYCSILSFLHSALDWLAQLGRASLFVFILQFYVFGFMKFLKISSPLLLVCIFAICIIVIQRIARYWSMHGYNRYFTVGLR